MKRLFVIAAWVAATFVTGLVAWSAVTMAGDQVNVEPVLPLSASEIADLPVSSTGGTSPPESTTTTPGSGSATLPGTTSTPSSTVPAATSTTSMTSPSTTLPDTTSTTGASTTTTTTGASTTTSTTPNSTTSTTTTTSTTSPPTSTTTPSTSTTSTTTTTVPDSDPEILAYNLQGGRVVISVVPGEVRLQSASPNQGFTMDIEDDGPDEVEVEFESDNHTSVFKAEWRNGQLDVEIVEEDEGGDDDG